MTTLEIILSIVIWIGYGIFASLRTSEQGSLVDWVNFMLIILFSPLVFFWRMLRGVTNEYEIK